MERNRNNRGPEEPRDTSNNVERKSTIPNDLPDSREDREKLRDEETVINLPDVKDIPGQEFVDAPPLGEMADTTISSDGEEGAAIFDRDEDEDLTEETSFNVRNDERQALADSEYMPTTDEDNLRTARMDNADFDNEPLNEKGFGQELSGSDLDLDTADETNTDSMGQGDEENKHYSLGSSDNDNVTEGTP